MTTRSTSPVLALEGVTKSFREGRGPGETGARKDRVVLSNAHLEIARGERVVLLGRSGSGKSTVLNLLAGLDRPDSGSVRLEGVDLAGLDETGRTLLRRRRIGFVFQSFNLVPTLTVEENLLFPLELLHGRTGRTERDRVQALLDELGLGERGASFPDVLSGGEQQRVAVARALVHEPALVLADEPTGNLDLDSADTVLALLDRAVGRAGATLVMATHSQDVADRADRVLRVEGGTLVEVSRAVEALPGAETGAWTAAEPAAEPAAGTGAETRAGARPPTP